LRHPSLRAKKYDQARNIWQGRINDDWRCYFRIEGDTCELLSIGPHPKQYSRERRLIGEPLDLLSARR